MNWQYRIFGKDENDCFSILVNKKQRHNNIIMNNKNSCFIDIN